MSRRKCGDDDSQDLMPFVQRIEPPGRVAANPGSFAKVPPAEKFKPEKPQFPPPAYAQPLWEGGFVYNGVTFWFRSNDARPWYARIAEAGVRVVIIKIGLAIFAFIVAVLAPTPTAREPINPNGWAPIIERAR